MITTRCENCGKIIKVENYSFKKHKHHFCSLACDDEYRRHYYNCVYCGKRIQRPPSAIRKYKNGPFCSLKCLANWKEENKPFHSYNELPYEWGYWFGALCSDGSVSKNSAEYQSRDKQHCEKLVSIVEKITEFRAKIRPKLTKGSYCQDKYILWAVGFWNRKLIRYTLENGCYDTYNWRVPDIVLYGDKEGKRGFLNGFFDSDGFSIKPRWGKGWCKCPSIGFTSINLEGIKQLGSLLDDFNIKYTIKPHRQKYWRLLISKKKDVFTYWEKVGITSERKRREFIEKINSYLQHISRQVGKHYSYIELK